MDANKFFRKVLRFQRASAPASLYPTTPPRGNAPPTGPLNTDMPHDQERRGVPLNGSCSSPIRLLPDFDRLIVSLLYVLRESDDERFTVRNFAYKGFLCGRPSRTLSPAKPSPPTVPVPSAVTIYNTHHRLSEHAELQTSYDQLVLVIAGALSSGVFTKASVFAFLLPPPDLLSAV